MAIDSSARVPSGARDAVDDRLALQGAGDLLLLPNAILWEAEAQPIRFTFVSKSAASILGYPRQQWLDEPEFWQRHIHADDREEVDRTCREAVERGEDRELEYRMVAADGHTVWLHDRMSVTKGAGGQVECLRGLMTDITSHKRLERRLFVQYAVTQILAEANTLDEAWPNVLEAICSALGWDLGQLWAPEPGEDILRLKESRSVPSLRAAPFQEDSRRRTFERRVGLPGRVWATAQPSWISDLAQDPNFPRAPVATESGLRSGFAFPVLFGNNVLSIMEFFSRQRREQDDDLLAAFASFGSQVGQFIERKRVEGDLRESEARFRAVVSTAAEGIIAIDERGVIQSLNPAVERLFGYPAEELIGQKVNLLMPEPYQEEHDQYLARYLTTGEKKIIGIGREVAGRRKDGTTFPMFLSVAEVAVNGRRMFTGIVHDLTERTRAEEELRDSAGRIRLAMEASGMGTWDWDVRTGQVKWSEGLEVIHGYAPGTFGGTFEDFLKDVHPEDREALVAKIQASLGLGTHDVEYRIVRPDGSVRWVNGKGQVICDERGRPVRMLGICMDVTEKKQAADRQQLLAEAGAALASSLESDTVLAHLAQLIVGRMADWCSIDVIEEDGSVRRLVVAHADPRQRESARILEQYVPPDTSNARDLVALLSRKALLYPELSEEQLAAAAMDERHYQIMRDLGFKSVMIVPLRARGRLLGAITFVYAESGRRYAQDDLALADELAYRAALAMDNARLYGESQRIQEELRKANEMKDEFLGLVSHELRTPITTIFGGARLLRSRGDRLAEASRQEVLQDIEGEAERLRRVVEDLLVLARVELGQEVTREPALVQRAIDRAVNAFEQRYPGRVIERRIDATLPPVAAEATYLEQVLRNLLSNAGKYSPPGTPIEVRAEAGDGEAIVAVLDRGPGIEPEEAESIFERFYRSPRVEMKVGGMGLGLTVCKRLIEAQAGRIWARPRAGGGLEVGFALPLHPDDEMMDAEP